MSAVSIAIEHELAEGLRQIAPGVRIEAAEIAPTRQTKVLYSYGTTASYGYADEMLVRPGAVQAVVNDAVKAVETIRERAMRDLGLQSLVDEAVARERADSVERERALLEHLLVWGVDTRDYSLASLQATIREEIAKRTP